MSYFVTQATLGADELQTKPSKRRNKRRGKQSPLSNNESTDWVHMTPKSLWSLLKAELSSYWDWDLTADGIDAAIEKYMGQKVSLLRAFCQRTGIQVTHYHRVVLQFFQLIFFPFLDSYERIFLRSQESQYIFRRRYH